MGAATAVPTLDPLRRRATKPDIGLIAVVRRILVVLAETDVAERKPIDFLIEVGGLAALAVVLALSIHLLRRTATQQP